MAAVPPPPPPGWGTPPPPPQAQGYPPPQTQGYPPPQTQGYPPSQGPFSPGESSPPPPPEAAEPDPADRMFTPLHGSPVDIWVRVNDPSENWRFNFAVRDPHEGVRVVNITENGPFHRAGVPCGQLLEVNGIPVTDTNSVVAAVRATQRHAREFVIKIIPDPSLPVPPPFKYPTHSPSTGGSVVDPYVQQHGATSMQRSGYSNSPTSNVGLGMHAVEDDETIEEFLARKLHSINTLHRHNRISTDTYTDVRGKVMKHMRIGQSFRGGDTGFSPRRHYREFGTPVKTQAPYRFAQMVSSGLVHLRAGPGHNHPLASAEGVVGNLRTMHRYGEWVYVRTARGMEGYIEEYHIEYLPHGPNGYF